VVRLGLQLGAVGPVQPAIEGEGRLRPEAPDDVDGLLEAVDLVARRPHPQPEGAELLVQRPAAQPEDQPAA
jgi:hypothetical protein